MAHEGGHSMHSYFSKTNNPFMCYNYTIFEAEVASTFNEELVFEYLLREAKTPEMKAYLISMRADDILATLHRQTMFAEFELKAHEFVENGTPLSAQVLRKTYRGLLEQYFGSEMHFEEESDMESLIFTGHSMSTNMPREFRRPLPLQNGSLVAAKRSGKITLSSSRAAEAVTRLKALRSQALI